MGDFVPGILKCFLKADVLKFSDIELASGIDSNKLEYCLEKLMLSGFVGKEGEFYFLTEKVSREILGKDELK